MMTRFGRSALFRPAIELLLHPTRNCTTHVQLSRKVSKQSVKRSPRAERCSTAIFARVESDFEVPEEIAKTVSTKAHFPSRNSFVFRLIGIMYLPKIS